MNLARLIPAVVERATGADSNLHGLQHWRTVARIGRELCARTPAADAEVVEAFAFLHDAMRVNDSEDPGHGARGAQLATELRASGILDATDEQFAKLVRACRDHTNGGTTSDPTIGICWDADRLDLGRVGVKPVASLLSTEAARERVSAGRVTEPRTVGWRVWRFMLKNGEPRLASPEMLNVWEPGRTFVATCNVQASYPGRVQAHAVPHERCSCGVYVSPDVRRALEGFHGAGLRGGSGFVAGRVRLGGRIVASNHGEGEWKGERATILDLYLPRSLSFGIPRLLADAYGVPVETMPDLRSLGDATTGTGAINTNDRDYLEALYEIRGWRKQRDALGRLVPPDGFFFGRKTV
jgi:uncharacterized protein